MKNNYFLILILIMILSFGLLTGPAIAGTIDAILESLDNTSGFVVKDSALTELFRVSGDGNVGIGTSSPGLAGISGTYISIAGSADRAVLELIDTRTGQGAGLNGAQMLFLSSENASNKVIGSIISQFAGAGTDKGGRLLFRTKPNAGALADAMIIDESGYVGIGTTTPDALLDISSSVLDKPMLQITRDDVTKGIRLTNYNGSNTSFALEYTSDLSVWNNLMAFNPNTGNVGIGTASPNASLQVAGTIRADNINGPALFNEAASVTNPTLIPDLNDVDTGIGAATSNTLSLIVGGTEHLRLTGSKVQVISGGSETGPAIVRQGDTNTGMFWAGDDILAFGTASSERMRIDSSGNVGIGTASPGAKLDVAGNINISGAGSHTIEETGGGLILKAAGNVNLYPTNGSIAGFGGVSNYNLKLYKGGVSSIGVQLHTNGVSYLNGGNVGIGTASPDQMLHVNAGSIKIDGNTQDLIFDANTGTDNSILFTTDGSTERTGIHYDGVNDKMMLRTVPNLSITFDTQTGSGGGERMRITGAGNVGIGTTSPTELLVVGTDLGDITSAASALVVGGNNAVLQIGNTNSTGFGVQYIDSETPDRTVLAHDPTGTSEDVAISMVNGNVGIGTTSPGALLDVSGDVRFGPGAGTNKVTLFSGSGSDGQLIFNDGNDAGRIQYLHGSNEMLFSTNGVAGANERMRIDSSGNVGMGTTSPTAGLHTQGNLSSALTGTVAVTNASAIVTGTTTAFDTELAVGDAIKIGTETFTVSAIGSATSLTLDSNYAGTTDSGLTAYNDPNLMLVTTGDAVSKFTLTPNGDALIGSGTFDNASDSEDLYVTGNLEIDGSVYLGDFATDTLTVTGNSTLGTVTGDLQVTGAGPHYVENGNVGIGTATPTHKFHVDTTGSANALVVDDAQARVGINTNSLSGALNIGGARTLVFQGGAGIIDSSSGGAILLRPGGSDTWNFTTSRFQTPAASDLLAVMNVRSDTDSRKGLVVKAFSPTQSGNLLEAQDSTGSPHFLVGSSGNVGIGTTTPNSELQVSGTIDSTAMESDSYTINSLNFAQESSGDINLHRGAGGNLSAFASASDGENPEFRVYGFPLGAALGHASFQIIGANNDLQVQPGNVNGDILLSPTSGNVGIGTTSPNQLLEVVGNQRISNNGVLEFFGGTTYPQLSRNSVSGGLIIDTSGNVSVSVPLLSVRENAGTDYMTIDGAGNVGIGTTSPLEKLHVSGQVLLGDHTADRNNALSVRREDDGNVISATRTGSDVEALVVRVEGNKPSIFSNNSDINLGYGTSGGFTDGITIKNTTGNVGIGTATPTAQLHAQGALSTALTGTVAVTNASAAVTGTTTAFDTELAVGDSIKIGTETFTVSAIGSATSLTLDSNYAGTTDTGLTAYSDPNLLAIDTGDAANLVTVTKSGDVGVGVASPEKKFHVDVGGVNKDGIKIKGAGVNIGLSIENTGGSGQNWSIASSRSGHADGAGKLLFSQDYASGADVTFQADGKVGIGTTTPTEALEVVGSIKATSFIGSGGNSVDGHSLDAADDSPVDVVFVDNAGLVGVGTTSPEKILHVKDSVGGIMIERDDGGNSFKMRVGTGNVNVQHVDFVNKLDFVYYPNWDLTGTSSTKMDITSDTINMNNRAYISTGGIPSYIPLNVTGAASQSADYVNVTSDGGSAGDIFTIDSAGNVGIGTASPSEKLDVVGNVEVSGAISAGGVLGTGLQLSDEGSYQRLQSYSSKPLAINSLGNNVGIGTTTPDRKLDIEDNAIVGLRLTNTAGSQFDIQASGNTSVYTLDATSLLLGTNNTAAIGIDSSQNVGIGTASPDASLHIDNGANSLPATSGTSQTGSVARLQGAGATILDIGSFAAGGQIWLQGTDNSDLSGTREILLNPNGGNVGIGTTSPLGKLHVEGDLDVTSRVILHDSGTPTIDRVALELETLDTLLVGSANLNGVHLAPQADLGLFVDRVSAGDVRTGIGTKTPSALLHAKGTVSTALTGTVAVTNASATVTGTTTAFDTELAVGDAIKIGTEVFTVATITNATSLTLDSNYAGTTDSGLTAYNDPNLMLIATGDAVTKLTVTPNGDALIGSGTFDNASDSEDLYVTGNLEVDGNVHLGDFATDTLTVTGTSNLGTVTSDLQVTGAGPHYVQNGNVGIGTTTPGGNLDIDGVALFSDVGGFSSIQMHQHMTFTAGGGIHDVNGVESANASGPSMLSEVASATNPTLLPNRSDPDTGLGWESADTGALVAGGVNVLNFENTGNVGIGTTSPAQILHTYRNDATESPSVQIEQEGTGDASMRYLLTGATGWTTGIDNSDSNTFKIGVASDLSASFLNIDTSGNVGIGTTSPTTKLHVLGGDAIFENTATTAQQVVTSKADTASTIMDAHGSAFVGTLAGVNRANMSLIEAQSASSLLISTVNSGSAPIVFSPSRTERVRITDAGNVGIGTTAPYNQLSIYGAAPTETAGALDVVTNKGGTLLLHDSNSPVGSGGSLLFSSTNANNDAHIFAGMKGLVTSAPLAETIAAGHLAFYTSNATSGSTISERMRIDKDGNVGIGTTSPGSRLEVAGQIKGTGYGGAGLALDSTSTNGMYGTYDTTGGTVSIGMDSNAGAVSGENYASFIWNTDVFPILFGTNGSERMRIEGTKTGIGTKAPSGPLSVTPTQYSTGTASQATNTITGVGTTFTSAMTGSRFVFADGTSAGTITAFNSATSLTVDTSQTVSSQGFDIAYTGLQVASDGRVGIGTASPTTNFEVGNAGGAPFTTAPDVSAQVGSITDGHEIAFVINSAEGINNRRAKLFLDDTTGIFGLDMTATTDVTDFQIQRAGNAILTAKGDGTGNVGIGTTTPTAGLHTQGNLSSALTGTVAVTNASAAVTGTTTAFDTELAVGDAIKIETEVFTVSAIGSATALTLDSNYAGTTDSGLTAYNDPNLMLIATGDAVTKLTVTPNGDALIGSGTFDNASDSEDLYVTGNLEVDGNVHLGDFATDTLTVTGNSTLGTVTGNLQVTGAGPHYVQNGNVGIGTTNPINKFEVVGDNADFTLRDTAGGLMAGLFSEPDNDGKMQLHDGSHNIKVDIHSNADSYFNGGNVGIGTTSPESNARLDVAGGDILLDNNQQYQIENVAGTNVRVLTVNSDDDVIIGDSNADDIFFAVGTLGEAMRIKQTTGNVGIGTNNPGEELDVVGTIRAHDSAASGAGNIDIGVNTINNGSSALKFIGSNSATNWRIRHNDAVAGDLTFTPSTAGGGTTFTTPAMAISSGGNVGIGTTSPDSLLDLSASNTGVVLMMNNEDTTVADTQQLASIQFKTDDANNPTTVMGSVGFESEGTAGLGAIVFGTGSSNTERMRIDNAGLVGIGTTSPGADLHISPSGQYTSIDGNKALLIHNPGITAANIAFGINGAVGNSIQSRDGTSVVWPLALNPFGGNVGIGTTSPNTTLDVDSGGAAAYFSINGGNAMVGSLNNAETYYGASQIYRFRDDFTINAGTDNVADSNFIVKTSEAGVSYGERFRVNNAGNVGIGTNTPTAQLHAKGNLNTALTGTVAVTNASAAVTGTTTAFDTELVVGDAIKIGTEVFTVSAIGSATALTLDSTYAGTTDSGLTAYSDPNLLAIDTGDAANVITVTKSGKVGIGNATPTESLNVTGNISLGGSGFVYIPTAGGIGNGGGGSPRLKFSGTEISTVGTGEFEWLAGNVGIGTATPSELLEVNGNVKANSFIGSGGATIDGHSLDAADGTPTDALYVDNAGNVGIGTTNPGSYKLVAKGGNGLSLLDTSDEPYLQAWNCVAEGACLVLYKDGGATRAAEIRGDGNPSYFNDGNVGIGTTTPAAKFHIVGPSAAPANLASFDTASTAQFAARSGDTTSLYIAEGVGGTGIAVQGTDGAVDSSTAKDINLNPYGGNVGIGTTSPRGTLDIKQAADARVSFENGTVANAIKLNFADDANSPIRSQMDAFLHQFLISGTEMVRIDSSGNVGIGTTSPEGPLHVYSTSSPGALFEVANSGGESRLLLKAETGATAGGDGGGAIHGLDETDAFRASMVLRRLGTASGNNAVGDWPIDFYTSQTDGPRTQKMRILGNGNVGIGTTTPGSLLTVQATSAVAEISSTASTAVSKLELGSGTGATSGNDGGGRVDVTDETETTRASMVMRRIKTVAGNNAIGDYPIRFENAAADGNSTEKMRILGNGNVGIGTTSPGALLTLKGSAEPQFVIRETDDGNDAIRFQANTGRGYLGLLNDGVSTIVLNGQIGQNSYINNGANFGIGTTTPEARLHVTGEIYLDGGTPVIRYKDGVSELATTRVDGTDFRIEVAGKPRQTIDASGNVGIGSKRPSGPLSVTPTQYSTGTASQALTTVTGVGTTFTSAMVGSQLVFNDGTSAGTITAFNSATSLTVDTSQTVSSQSFDIAYTGLQVASDGKVGIGMTAPTEALEVSGNVKAASFIGSGGATIDGSSLDAADGTPTNALIVDNAGNIGVGQATPTSPAGSARFIHIGDSSVTSAGIALEDNTGGGRVWEVVNNNDLFFQADGSKHVTINSAGDVGIGETSPQAELHITQSASTLPSLDTSTGVIFQNNSATGNENRVSIISGNAARGILNFGDAEDEDRGRIAYKQDTDTMSFRTATADRMVVDADGDVGIGDTSPDELLTIASDDPTLAIKRVDATVTVDEIIGEVEFVSGDISVGSTGVMANIEAIAQNGDETDLRFLVGHSTGSGAPTLVEAMRLESTTGNVGIGTTSPSALLTIEKSGTSYLLDYNDIGGGLIGRTRISGTTLKFLAQNNYNLSFGTDDTDQLTIKDGGNVGIGTTSPGYLLDVQGTASVGTTTDGGALRIEGKGGSTYPWTLRTTTLNGGLDFNSNSGTTVFFDTDGPVGIGTTTPSAQLHTKGSLSSTMTGTVAVTNASATVTGTGTAFDTELDPGDAIKIGTEIFTVSAIASQTSLTLDSNYAGTTDSGLTSYMDPQHFNIDTGDGANILTVARDGNVGIGTTDPDSSLEISKGGSTNVELLKLTNSQHDTNSQGAADLIFAHTMSLGERTGRIRYQEAANNINDADFHFILPDSSAIEQTRLYIDGSNGNVGIGTATPAEKLDVVGNIQVDAASDICIAGGACLSTASGSGGGWTDDGTAVRLTTATDSVGIGTSTPDSELHVQAADAATVLRIENTATDGDPRLHWELDAVKEYMMGIDDGDGDKLKIATSGAADWSTAAFTMDTAGNVGIGAANPVATLHVNGPVRFGSRLTGGRVGSAYDSIGWNTDYSDNVNEKYYSNDNASKLAFETGGFSFYSAPSGTAGNNITFTQRMRILENGNVGIGTTSPGAKLDVNGNIRIPNQGIFLGRNAANSADLTLVRVDGGDNLELGGGSGTNVDTIKMFASGSQRFHIDASGNVGIGTASPSEMLSIGTSSAAEDAITSLIVDRGAEVLGAGDTILRIRSTGTGGTTWGLDQTVSSGTAGRFNIKEVGVAERLTILKGGNVGIGTTSPAEELHVWGPTNDVQLIVEANGVAADSEVRIHSNDGRTSKVRFADDTDANIGRIDYYHSDDSMRFHTNDTEKIRIASSGNVGIGTTAPDAALDVAGHIIADDGTRGIRIAQDASGSGNRALIYLDQDSTDGIGVGADYLAIIRDGINAEIKNVGTGNLSLMTDNTERITIDGAGNVGIGTASPSGQLSVTPTQYSTGTASQSTTTITGVGTTFTSAMVGSQFVFADGTSAGTITAFNSATSLTVSVSQTVSSQGYDIAYTGLQVASDGNVGIGITNPWAALQVKNGPIAIDSGYYVGTGGSATELRFGAGTGGAFNGGYIYTYGGTHARLGDLVLHAGDQSGASPEIMTIDGPTGNVGIGVTDPDADLEINGQIKITGGVPGANKVLTSDANGLATWETASGGGDASYGSSASSPADAVYVIDSGNVGIGTTNPGEAFHLVGTNGFVRLSNLETNATSKHARIGVSHYTTAEQEASVLFAQSTDTENQLHLGGGSGFMNAATSIKFHTAADNITTTGSERMIINSAGNVGIGTASPASLLHIESTNPTLRLSDSDDVNNSYSIVQTDGAGSLVLSADNANATASSLLGLNVDGSRAMTVISGGNVGIGTTSPDADFEVEKSTAGTYVEMDIDNTNAAALSRARLLLKTVNGGAMTSFSGSGASAATSFSIGQGGGETYLSFTADSDVDDNAPAMVILQDNKVGIGTTAPAAEFEVRADADHAQVVITGGDNSANDPYVEFRTGLTPTTRFSLGVDNADDKFKIMSGAGIGGTSEFVIDSGGQVGIGQITPGAKLEVAGQVKITGGTPGLNQVLTSDANGLATWEPSPAADASYGSSGSSPADAVYVDDSGYVGIGTTSPAVAQLHQAGTLAGTRYGHLITTRVQPDVNAESFLMKIEGTIDEFSSGTHSSIGSLLLSAPTITAGAADVTEAATLRIAGAPTGATNNYALKIASGTVALGTGNVGIGTNSPSSLLDVEGSSPVIEVKSSDDTSASLLVDGGATADAFAVFRDAGVSRYIAGYDDNLNIFDISAGGSFGGDLVVDASGNVGIGTTSPSTINGYTPGLQISGGAPAVNFEDTGDSTSYQIGYESAGTGGLYFQHSTAGDVLLLGETGNVGIGTVSPGNQLHIVENAEADAVLIHNDGGDQNRDVLKLQGGADNVIGNTTFISIADGDGTEHAWIHGAVDSADGGLAISTTTEAAADFVIDELGNVGIGTTSPAADFGSTTGLGNRHFQVHGDTTAGNIAAGRTTTTDGDIVGAFVLANIDNDQVAGDRRAAIAFISGEMETTDANAGGDSGGHMLFYTKPEAAVSSERMRITSAGNVGIGTSSPGHPLDVNGIIQGRSYAGFGDTGVANPYFTLYSSRNFTAPGTANPSTGLRTDGTITGLATGGHNMYGTAILNSFAEGATSGTHSLIAQLYVDGNAITTTGGASTTNAAALYIDGPMTGATNNYALYSTSGTNYFGGNVGIGTTAPGGLLGLADANTYLNKDGSNNMTFTDAVTGTKTLAELAASGGGGWTDDGTSVRLTTATDNVGIGTASPGALLDVSSDTGSTTIAPTTIRISSTADGQGWDETTSWGNLDFYSADVSGGPAVKARIGTLAVGAAASASRLAFSTHNGSTFSEKMTIDNAGQVGIGTTSPQSNLHVFSADVASITPHVQADELVLENTDYAGLTILADNATSLHFGDNALAHSGQLTYTHLTDEMRLFTANTLALSIQGDQDVIVNSGNVGIGTTDVEAWSNFTAVQIGPESSIAGGPTSTYGTTIQENAYFDGAWKYRSTGEAARFAQADGDTYIMTAPSGTIDTAFSWTTALFVENDNGNVGIGTTAPEELLNVFGTNTAIMAEGNGITKAGFKIKTNDTLRWDINSPSGSSDLRFNNGSTDVMTMLNSGNVGIGEAAPNSELHVVGPGSTGGNIQLGSYVALGNERSSGATILGNNVRADAVNSNEMEILSTHAALGGRAIRMADEAGITFHTSDGSVTSGNTFDSERMRIDENGDVGIGTTSPGAKVHVENGNSTAYSATDAAGQISVGATAYINNVDGTGSSFSQLVLGHSTDTSLSRIVSLNSGANTTQLTFVTENGSAPAEAMRIDENRRLGIGTTGPELKLDVEDDIEIGTGTTGCVRDADNTTLTGTCVSDERLKKNIKPLTGTLDKLVKLEPVTFEWRNDEFDWLEGQEGDSYGLIAQEVEKVFPEMVHEDDRNYKRVAYDVSLTMRLLQGIKEQQALIEALKKIVCEDHPEAEICEEKAKLQIDKKQAPMQKIEQQSLNMNFDGQETALLVKDQQEQIKVLQKQVQLLIDKEQATSNR